MDLRTLSYFVTVAEELNITHAAEKLCMSQPPLSSQIKALEAELNTTLFIRGKRHLQLTESGKLLYRRATELLGLADKASSEIISMSRGMSGTISIGLVEGSAPYIAAGWIDAMTHQHPQLKFRIMAGNSDEVIAKLRSGLINLAVIAAPCDQSLLNSIPVGTETMSAFLCKETPLAMQPGDSIRMEDLKGQPLIVPNRKAVIDTIYKRFKAIRAEPNIVCETNTYLDVVALAKRNVGIGIFPKTADTEAPGVVVKTITDPEYTIEYLFVWLKGHPLPTPEEALIDHVKGI